MRHVILPLLLLALVFSLPAQAATPVTFEVIDGTGKAVARLDIPVDQIADVTSGFDPSGRPVLNMRLATDARKAFGAFTKAHLYKLMRVRIGDKVLTPGARLMSPILGGSLQLNGLDAKEIEAAKKLLAK